MTTVKSGNPFESRHTGSAAADNPFRAPAARVEDVSDQLAGELIENGQRVPTGHGVAWIGRGWELFKMAPGVWIGIVVVLFVLIIVMSLIPILNLAVNLVMPIFAGGIMLGCRALDEGEPLEFAHLFAGFKTNAGNLVLVGVFYLLGILLIVAVVSGIVALGVLGGAAASREAMFTAGLLIVLAGLAFGVPLAMAFWFAPALVAIHNVPAFKAMKMSFIACLKNFLPFLVYSLVLLVVALVAMIPIGLGLLVLLPVIYGSMYASYRDMFVS